MSYKWDNNDRKIWESSDVLKELEKRLGRVTIELAKKAQEGASKKVEELQQATEKAKESVTELANTVEREVAADDEETPTEEEDTLARETLINELREMAFQASKDGNIKLAYKIERTIDELIFGE